MAQQIAIPCILMRGGTSKGPYFLSADLPADQEGRNRVLLAAMGSPDIRQIDGLGGADTLTSKVAVISPSQRRGVDVDYLFAQVSVEQAVVDVSPSCGNILAGVGPFAIERGLVPVGGNETSVIIHDVNTGSRIEALIQTDENGVVYDGDARIDGVPGGAAPIRLNFMDIVGSKTGKLLPTGHLVEDIEGVAVTLLDVAVPMMIVRAADMGKTGYEDPGQLDADTAFFKRLETMRRIAGQRMGLGDVAGKVIPKVAMIAAPQADGHLAARYFVPHKTHAAFAVTGGLCVATCAVLRGSVSDGLVRQDEGDAGLIRIEHPSGSLEITLETSGQGSTLQVVTAGVLRTARKLMSGYVFVPDKLAKS